MNYNFNIGIFVKNFLPSTKRTAYHISWLKALLNPMQFWQTQFFSNYVNGYSGNDIINYDATRTFNVGELVYYSGIIYENILASTGNLPTNATYFQVRSFVFGEMIQNSENSVYYCISDNPNGYAPVNETYWYLLQQNFIGLNDRVRANAQILVYEYILNKWFSTSFNYPTTTNDVYITNNAVDINGFIVGSDETESSFVGFNDNQQESFINLTYSTVTYNYTINIPLAVYDALKPTDASGTTSTKDAIVRNFADKYNLAGLSYSINPY
jgi:hypothetical protein